MTAYDRAHRALTSGRPLPAAEAAQLLADLRRETGTELADVIEKQLDGRFRRRASDSANAFRNKKRVYATSMRVVLAIRRLTAIPARPTIPNPRTNGSTS